MNECEREREGERHFLTDVEMKKKKKKMETFIYIKEEERIKFFQIIIVSYTHLAPNDVVIFNQFKLMHADILIQIRLLIKTKFYIQSFKRFHNDNLIRTKLVTLLAKPIISSINYE